MSDWVPVTVTRAPARWNAAASGAAEAAGSAGDQDMPTREVVRRFAQLELSSFERGHPRTTSSQGRFGDRARTAPGHRRRCPHEPAAVLAPRRDRPVRPPPPRGARRRPRRGPCGPRRWRPGRPAARRRRGRHGVLRGPDRAELPGGARVVDDGADPAGVLLPDPDARERHPGRRRPHRCPTSSRAASWPVSSTSTRRRRSRRRCRSRRSRWWCWSSTAGRCRCSRTRCRSTSCAPRSPR